ncbi:MAG TPA: hypothetical protein VK571_04155 [Gemmatimonadaceae bacterium]|nr:hypothetical protein [Gemmatimonadaceae bacterium]
MQSPLRILVLGATAAVMVACASDNSTSPIAASEAAAALASAPIGFDRLNSSFVGDSDISFGFMPWRSGDGDLNRFGPGWHEFMGGGLGEAFIGGIGFGPGFALGPGFGRGPFGDWRDSDDCSFSTTSNRVECSTFTRRGLTINRSFSFLDASGAVQQAFDRGTTNTVNVMASIAGTTTHHETATSTVNASSDFTVAGLATGSTQRKVDGKSAGTESTTGTRHGDAFTSLRSAGDTVSGIVIPIQEGRPTYPTAGSIIRSMQATVTVDGQTPSTSSRREVITYDGSATAQVVITHDGVTKNCTKPLPHGRLTCQ